MTRTRNPNYHGVDEKYPDNRLPYVDEVKALFMAEAATRLAAMRTGQIDMIHRFGGGTTIGKVEVVNALLGTNPDIQVGTYFQRALQVSGLNIRKPPFDDIRVRQAMQMALDRDAINDSYYGGFAQRKPSGYFGDASGPVYTPFDEWPKELQDAYSYNPEKAEQLLDAAGYPRGADGVRFKVTYDFRNIEVIDLGYVEIAAGYWKEIGVEVEITLHDTGSWVPRRVDGLYDMTTGDQAWDQAIGTIFAHYGRIVEGEKHCLNEYFGGIPDPTLVGSTMRSTPRPKSRSRYQSRKSSTCTSSLSIFRYSDSSRPNTRWPSRGSRAGTASRSCRTKAMSRFLPGSGSTGT